MKKLLLCFGLLMILAGCHGPACYETYYGVRVGPCYAPYHPYVYRSWWRPWRPFHHFRPHYR